MTTTKWPKVRRRLASSAKYALCTLNRYLGRYKHKVLILGEGRSGTSWLANILNYDDRYRLMFEPFQAENLRPPVTYPSEYLIPDDHLDGPVHRHIERVIRGDYISANVNVRFPRYIFDGLLIKDISAHLIVDEITQAAPDMKCVFILRHPFAVAASKSKIFSWPTRPSFFLSDRNPRRAELEQNADLILRTEDNGDPLMIQVLLWCMSTSYALSANSIGQFTVIYYEDLVQSPESEAEHLFRNLGMIDLYTLDREQIFARSHERSHVTYANNVISQSRKGIGIWLSEWSRVQIETGLQLLEAFELDNLYDDKFTPCEPGRERWDRENDRSRAQLLT